MGKILRFARLGSGAGDLITEVHGFRGKTQLASSVTVFQLFFLNTQNSGKPRYYCLPEDV